MCLASLSSHLLDTSFTAGVELETGTLQHCWERDWWTQAGIKGGPGPLGGWGEALGCTHSSRFPARPLLVICDVYGDFSQLFLWRLRCRL